jgi:hypothetical protein
MVWVTVRLVLTVHLLYPYHLQQLQALRSVDFCLCKECYQLFLQQCGEGSFFSSCVLITSEASFARNCILNSYNLEWHVPTQYSSVQMSAALCQRYWIQWHWIFDETCGTQPEFSLRHWGMDRMIVISILTNCSWDLIPMIFTYVDI